MSRQVGSRRSSSTNKDHQYDNIHGNIRVPPLLRAVIDTPQFNRLRSIKQLGLAYLVYPSADHNRYAHSLGVMHLADEFLVHLRKDESLGITEVDHLCVMMAGLCHDLGHGPFSHLWEGFIREAQPGLDWHHEESSIEMFNYLIQENDLEPVFWQHGLTETDLEFIKEMIHFNPKPGEDYRGRGPEKHFLYEIIANKITGVDVDKWDYMMRDDAGMKIGITFDYERLIHNCEVKEVKGKLHLCFRDKEVENLQKMYLDRRRLHENGYQHKTVKKLDRMMIDVLLSADEHLHILRGATKNEKISEACKSPSLLSQLSDDFLLKSIENSDKPELQKSRDILKRIHIRCLYKKVGGEVSIKGSFPKKVADMEKDLKKLMSNDNAEQVTIVKKSIDMGMKGENPLKEVPFFDKQLRIKAMSRRKLEFEEVIQKETLYVFCRSDEVIDEAENAYNQWRRKVDTSMKTDEPRTPTSSPVSTAKQLEPTLKRRRESVTTPEEKLQNFGQTGEIGATKRVILKSEETKSCSTSENRCLTEREVETDKNEREQESPILLKKKRKTSSTVNDVEK